MEIGLLKSKIETKLLQSYKDRTFESEIKKFKSLVLEDSSLSKAFYIYDELTKEKGFKNEFAEEYLQECSEIYNRIKFNKKNLQKLDSWVNGITCENSYQDLDVYLNKKTLVIEDILKSRDKIISGLTSKKNIVESVKISIEQMASVANESIKNYLGTLKEDSIKEINKYISLSEQEIKTKYNVISELVVEKLEKLSTNSDDTTKKAISETIEKIKKDEINYASLFKIKTLNENL